MWTERTSGIHGFFMPDLEFRKAVSHYIEILEAIGNAYEAISDLSVNRRNNN